MSPSLTGQFGSTAGVIGRRSPQTTSVMTRSTPRRAQSVNRPGLGAGVDRPDRVDDEGHAAAAGKEAFHRGPDAVVGGHSIDDEGRLRLVVAGDQLLGIRPAEDVEGALLEGQMGPDGSVEAIANREHDGIRPLGRRDSPLTCPFPPCSAAGTAGARGRRGVAAGGRQHGDPCARRRNGSGARGSRGSTAIPVRRAPRVFQEIALGVDIHEDERSFEHLGASDGRRSDGVPSFEKGYQFDSISLTSSPKAQREVPV